MRRGRLAELKRNIILFMLSSIVFGVVLSFLSWSVAYSIPAWLSPGYVAAGSILLLAVLGIVAFRLMVPPLRIRDAIQCYFVYNMEKNEALSTVEMNYDFWNIASYGFQELSGAKPEYNDVLKKPFELDSKILKQFMMYSILCWLGRLHMTITFKALRTKVPLLPRIYRDPDEKMKVIHRAYYTANITNAFVTVPSLNETALFHIQLPRSMRLNVTDDKVMIANRYLRIDIGYQVYEWSRGTELRVQNLLGLTEEETRSLASVSAIITFDARLNILSALSVKADVWWNFAKDMLENLRATYDWSIFMKDLKELLTWKMLTKEKSRKLD